MVRRLKSDLRHFGERFPERVVEPIKLSGLPNDAPELLLARMLADYGETVRSRAAGLPPRQAANARLSIVGLQQRLLSSIAAFVHTLEVHLRGLERAATSVSLADAEAYVAGPVDAEDEAQDEAAAEARTDAEQDQATEAAAALAAPISDRARVEAMLTIARSHANKPDARLRWLVQWIRTNLTPDGRWNDRRLILFTEFEDTRRWLLGVTTEARVASLPDVPAVAEILPGFALPLWFGLFGPNNLPPGVPQRLAQELEPLRVGSDLARRMEAGGSRLLLNGPESLAARVATEVPMWRDVVLAAGITPE